VDRRQTDLGDARRTFGQLPDHNGSVRPVAVVVSAALVLTGVLVTACTGDDHRAPEARSDPAGLELRLHPVPSRSHQRFTLTVHDPQDRRGWTGVYAGLDEWDGSSWHRIAWLELDHEAQDLRTGARFVFHDMGYFFDQPMKLRLPAPLDDGDYRISIEGSLPPVPPSNEKAGSTKVRLERVVALASG
jgi:hypothetical protein